MKDYIFKRILLTIPTIFGLTVIVFLLVRLLPGDVIDAMSGGEVAIDEGRRKMIMDRLGLNDPIIVQYGNWLKDIFSGDLGVSLRNAQPLREVFLRALPVTLEIGFISAFIACIFGIPLGLISATKPNTLIDVFVRLFGLIGLSFPNFWLATLLLLFTSLHFNWIPGLTYVPLWEDPIGNLKQMILPSVILSFQLMAITMRMTRATMLEELKQDYIRTARAKGLSMKIVVNKHAMKNAMIPILTIASVQLGYLLSGSVIIEQIFGLPGIGWFFLQGLLDRDYPVVQIMALFMVCVFVFVNLLTDIAYAYLDPRIKYDTKQ